MKKKFSILLILVVAVLTLAVVGYSAWYITREDKDVTVNNVEAFEVDSDDFSVAIVDGTVVFGRPTSGATNTGWLQYDNDTDDPEDLVATFTVTSEYTGDFTLSLADSASASRLYTYTFSGTGVSGNTLTISTANTPVTVTVNFHWALGSNPFSYFADANREKNTKITNSTDLAKANEVLGLDPEWTSDTHTYKEFAVQYLGDVYTMLNTATFTITVADAN